MGVVCQLRLLLKSRTKASRAIFFRVSCLFALPEWLRFIYYYLSLNISRGR